MLKFNYSVLFLKTHNQQSFSFRRLSTKLFEKHETLSQYLFRVSFKMRWIKLILIPKSMKLGWKNTTLSNKFVRFAVNVFIFSFFISLRLLLCSCFVYKNLHPNHIKIKMSTFFIFDLGRFNASLSQIDTTFIV